MGRKRNHKDVIVYMKDKKGKLLGVGAENQTWEKRATTEGQKGDQLLKYDQKKSENRSLCCMLRWIMGQKGGKFKKGKKRTNSIHATKKRRLHWGEIKVEGNDVIIKIAHPEQKNRGGEKTHGGFDTG